MRNCMLVAVAAIIATAMGCDKKATVGPGQIKEAVKWTQEYPVLGPDLEKSIRDDKLDSEEFKNIQAQYRTLVNKENMDNVRGKLNHIAAQDLKKKYEALVNNPGKNTDLVIKTVSQGETTSKSKEKAAPQPQKKPAPTNVNELVVNEPKQSLPSALDIDNALENALNNPVSVEKD